MMLPDHPYLDVALRLTLAFLLALPLGWAREQGPRSMGLRTYPILSICTCSFLLLAQSSAGGPGEQADVFFGLLGGIGFMAGGAILKARKRAAGMSTAVSLWVTGAIGAGVAYGRPFVSAALSLACLLVLGTPLLLRRRQGAP